MDDFPLPVLVLIVDHLPLGVADLLDDHLLRGLRGNAAEAGRVELHTDLVTNLHFGIVRAPLLQADFTRPARRPFDHALELEQLDFARVLVELGFDLALLPVPAASGGHQGLLERLDDGRPPDALVFADLIYDPLQIQLHGLPLCPLGLEGIKGLRPGDALERDVVLTRFRLHVRFVPLERHELAAEVAPSRQRLLRLHRHTAPDRACEVLLASQHAVDPR